MKKTLFALIIIFTAIVFGIGGWRLGTDKSFIIAKKDSVITSHIRVPSEREMERELIRYDIAESGKNIGLSLRQQEEYLKYLDSAATKYDLPMILIHTVVYVESGYDPSAVHPTITVKGKSTRALGLMGVVWEYNSSLLIKEGIASSRLELTEPKTNLIAGSAILYADIKEVIAKNPNISENQFFDELIRKYYGAYDEKYKARILTKIKDMASKQWIRRTVQSILVAHKTIQK